MNERISKLIQDARGPLNTISMNAELAKLLTTRKGPPEEIVKALEQILAECQRCSAIIEAYRQEQFGT